MFPDPNAARKGGEKTRDTHPPEHFRTIGGRGGKKTAARHGSDFYREIGKKGGARIRALIARAKAMEESDNA